MILYQYNKSNKNKKFLEKLFTFVILLDIIKS